MLVLNSRILGKNSECAEDASERLGRNGDGCDLFWRGTGMSGKNSGAQGKITATYYPSINEFRGQKTLQIVIQNYR